MKEENTRIKPDYIPDIKKRNGSLREKYDFRKEKSKDKMKYCVDFS